MWSPDLSSAALPLHSMGKYRPSLRVVRVRRGRGVVVAILCSLLHLARVQPLLVQRHDCRVGIGLLLEGVGAVVHVRDRRDRRERVHAELLVAARASGGGVVLGVRLRGELPDSPLLGLLRVPGLALRFGLPLANVVVFWCLDLLRGPCRARQACARQAHRQAQRQAKGEAPNGGGTLRRGRRHGSRLGVAGKRQVGLHLVLQASVGSAGLGTPA
mmetsp:Transcript_95445/g.265215  ORF Transcript_95445/g.265215 Transcript_95445/m.265215 type:complete len:215 (-) Transcript_95445:163-807(-)